MIELFAEIYDKMIVSTQATETYMQIMPPFTPF